MPKGIYPRKPLAERLWAKVNKDGPLPPRRPQLGPCWEWNGFTDRDGYGTISCEGKPRRVHRVAVELLVGPIPDSMEPDHLCFNPSCVKAIADEHGPAHLEVVTQRVNVLRSGAVSAINAAKTHCVHGHEFTPENTYIERDGSRCCRICRRNNSYTKWQRRKRREEGLDAQ